MAEREDLDIVRMDPPDAEDSARIGAFLADQVTGSTSSVAFQSTARWKLAQNSCRPGFAHAMTTSSDRKLVGLFTATPKPMWIHGREQVWAETGDTFTDAQFQRRGVFHRLHASITKAALDAGVASLYGLPNEASGPAYVKKNNWNIKANADLVTCTLIYGTTWLASALENKWSDAPVKRSLVRVLGKPLIDRPTRATCRLLARVRLHDSPEIIPLAEFGREFDELWERVRDRISLGIARTSRYLTWRFIDNPNTFRILTAWEGPRLVGYIVTLYQSGGAIHRGRLWIADWLFEPSQDNQVGKSLLRSALLDEQPGPVDLVVAWTTKRSPFVLPWSRFGFIVRRAPKPIIFYDNPSGREAELARGKWHFTVSDSDPF